ncbi:Chaperone modulatory protein CbpM [Candidatus Filomicrobium marinum]|uniref:Chaperone modulatory protein CbpM n=2 Tax=Filomicrobium TaxID=119044 RepID=A0A0D6JH86_9HYPH|nr:MULTISPECIES: chaperone modulator CbpM [Filomicrobium]MCV0369811.1 chaperone modulator CbpM [Filomicrobium sp.]CFX50953.1 Chaperone modulatory protein CbpM [Candidatus Filomicrobium marinum]CPR20176.1 Chaperone modulatory protein CbpM [Candidatus Filomicrobium marinum]SDP11426.1 chaperone modulatory protein CbpM [Filomicrobium insigne]
MAEKQSSVHTAELVSSTTRLTITEICQSCNVDRTWISELVSEGVLEPEGRSEGEWRFAAFTVSRVATARRLERDFNLNIPGIALALELLDEIEGLRARLRALEIPSEEPEDQ